MKAFLFGCEPLSLLWLCNLKISCVAQLEMIRSLLMDLPLMLSKHPLQVCLLLCRCLLNQMPVAKWSALASQRRNRIKNLWNFPPSSHPWFSYSFYDCCFTLGILTSLYFSNKVSPKETCLTLSTLQEYLIPYNSPHHGVSQQWSGYHHNIFWLPKTKL